jgi:TetR/AcrR family transcriptional regulator
MLKKLTDEKLTQILESGIAVFAEKGLTGANINEIARQAGISVGVLYKYYTDKEHFFLACLHRSLAALDELLRTQAQSEDKLLVRAEKIIRALQKNAREHPNDIRMYHEITTGVSRSYAPSLVAEIEGVTAKVYTRYIADAATAGDIRGDADAGCFAFFFDNLLMMLQFSYSCSYYKERFRLYCGDRAEDDAYVAGELLKLLESAFTFSASQVIHNKT